MNVFYQRWFLWSLVLVNALGTVWGILWYWEQLTETPWYFLPVVPDSPLHAALFGFFIYWVLRDATAALTPLQRFIAWAGVLGVVKYGLWTTVILSQYFWTQGVTPSAQDWMLYVSHGGMAVQGLVYASRLPKACAPAAGAVLWFIVNDVFDYLLFTHPRLPLPDQAAVAGWTNAALTVLAGMIAARLLRSVKDCR
ncbi:MAG TPA: DUF1405 domain-containing protein [Selenomonadales bacterium]|nr:DUF1405 domain-containing protein [Selenomonadales bacterium]